ncbi:hypothetical protein N7522_006356 [Penicillium canescens]|nr:hypothetical protein N7522_006356 [Penicillium canescens]
MGRSRRTVSDSRCKDHSMLRAEGISQAPAQAAPMMLWGELGPAMDEERRKPICLAGELIIPHPQHLRRGDVEERKKMRKKRSMK